MLLVMATTLLSHSRFGSHWPADPLLFLAGAIVVLGVTVLWAVRTRRKGD